MTIREIKQEVRFYAKVFGISALIIILSTLYVLNTVPRESKSTIKPIETTKVELVTLEEFNSLKRQFENVKADMEDLRFEVDKQGMIQDDWKKSWDILFKGVK
jgi:hypothetical protein